MFDRIRHILSHDSGFFWQFVKYGVVGVLSTLIQLAVFAILATTCLKCLTPDDALVRIFGFASAEFTGDEEWFASRGFIASVATAIGFTVANIFCWIMNRAFVFRGGRFRWYIEFALFFGVASLATLVALCVMNSLINSFGMMTSLAAVVEVIVSFAFNFILRKFVVFKG